MKNREYTRSFYDHRHEQTEYAATVILSLLLDVIPFPNSAIDVGCGVGTWLKVLRDKGIMDIRGLDGSWVDKDLLAIPQEHFQVTDLSEPLNLHRKFDLALSLEVAEHLPKENADGFVESLCNLSDFVLFSAAIPLQGGAHHANEQWPDYWIRLFHTRGYVGFDCIRRRIWSNKKIPSWYKQNVFLFVSANRLQDVKIASEEREGCSWPLVVVHPDTYLAESVQRSLRLLQRSLQSWLRRRLAR